MSASLVLAGDIGGTKTLLGLFEKTRRPKPIASQSFSTLKFATLNEMVAAFLSERPASERAIDAACFGVAGPVIGARARLTNVPWVVDAIEVQRQCSLDRVALLNDLEAVAWAVPVLEPDELAALQTGTPVATGNAALLAAGTGLGVALLHNIDGRFQPFASEGGHTDFAPRTAREIELQQALTRWFGRAHWEHVLSGPGLVNLHRFAHQRACSAVPDGTDPAEAPSLISGAALERRCAPCAEALELFVSAYGAMAGNLALMAVATGGTYIGGGIAPKILPALQDGRFMEAFRAKSPMRDLMDRIPVYVILNAEAGLLGAATFLVTH